MKFEEAVKALKEGNSIFRAGSVACVAPAVCGACGCTRYFALYVGDHVVCPWYPGYEDIHANDWRVAGAQCEVTCSEPTEDKQEQPVADEQPADAPVTPEYTGQSTVYKSLDQLRKDARSASGMCALLVISKPGCTVCANWRENTAPIDELRPVLAKHGVSYYESTSSSSFLKMVPALEKAEFLYLVPDSHYDAPVLLLAVVSGNGKSSYLAMDDVATCVSVMAEGPVGRKSTAAIDAWLDKAMRTVSGR